MQAGLKAPLSTQLFYGVGSISVGIKNNLLGTYLLIYYNQVLGLDAGVAAIAMSLALLVDAFSDPLVGVWSDRVRSRWGRRHPFMYAAIAPFALSYYLLLSDPGEVTETGLFARLLVLLVVLRVSMTFYEVPRGALAPELSKDYDQRNALSAWSMAFGWLGGAGIAFAANAFFLESFVDRSGYQTLAFWGGLGIFVGGVVSCLGTHRNIASLHQPEPRSFHYRDFLREAADTLANRSWLVLFAAGCFYALLVGLEQGVSTYYNEYLWQWKPETIALFSLASFFAVICTVAMAPIIARGRSKKRIAIGIFLFTILIGPLPVGLRLLELSLGVSLSPGNGTDLLWWLLLVHGSTMAALGALGFVFIGSMSMEIVEQVQTRTGRREEGLLGTVNSFVHKLIGAGGVLLSGIIISTSGFDAPDVTQEALYGGDVIVRFAWTHVVIGLVLPICSTLLIAAYDIDRDQHRQNLDALGYQEG